jgi:hypothetical protein
MRICKSMKEKISRRIIFILTVILALMLITTYKYIEENNLPQIIINITNEKNEVDCVELYVNNDYSKSFISCMPKNGKFYFKNLPTKITNLRIDFGSQANVVFRIDSILIETKKKSEEVLNIKDWGLDQIIIKNDVYSTTGNDPKIFGAVNYGSEENIIKNKKVIYIPIILILILLIYLIIISNEKYQLTQDFIIILGYAFGVISAFPGHTNFDELYTLGEYFRGEVSDMHPPIQMLLSANIIEFGKILGITPLYSISTILILQLAIYWWALQEIAKFIKNDTLRLVFLAVLCISPITLVYASHIGKDSQMAIGLLVSTALIMKSSKENRPYFLILAIFPLFYSYTIRANAPAAVLPLIIYWASVLFKSKINYKNFLKNILIPAFLLIIFINIVSHEINRHTIKIKCCSGIQLIMTPVYDLMGVSKEIRVNLVPSFLYINSYDLSDIDKNFDSTYINWNGLQQANYDQIIPVLKQWYLMVQEHPFEFVRHRISTLKYFFGLQQGNPAFPYMSGFYDNIEKTGKSSTTIELINGYKDIKPYLYIGEYFNKYFSITSNNIFYRFWIYILLNLLVYIYMVRKEFGMQPYTKALVYSSILYTLPYIILANSAQFRYVYWPALACYVMLFINLDNIISTRKEKQEN